jgi:hypothetical protein
VTRLPAGSDGPGRCSQGCAGRRRRRHLQHVRTGDDRHSPTPWSNPRDAPPAAGPKRTKAQLVTVEFRSMRSLDGVSRPRPLMRHAVTSYSVRDCSKVMPRAFRAFCPTLRERFPSDKESSRVVAPRAVDRFTGATGTTDDRPPAHVGCLPSVPDGCRSACGPGRDTDARRRGGRFRVAAHDHASPHAVRRGRSPQAGGDSESRGVTDPAARARPARAVDTGRSSRRRPFGWWLWRSPERPPGGWWSGRSRRRRRRLGSGFGLRPGTQTGGRLPRQRYPG